MANAILTLNAGSSSIKLELFDSPGGQLGRRYVGLVEAHGPQVRFIAKDANGATLHEASWELGEPGTNHIVALQHLAAWLEPRLPADGLLGVGHRVVHGGIAYHAPVLVDKAVLEQLEACVPLAPLHQPHNLSGIRAAMRFLPGVPNVACFDTAFHTQSPQLARLFALPLEYYNEGVRRYGFHGLSYEYITRRLYELAPEVADGRIVVAHLGNGASMCAISAGQSVDTTMGFTALDGLPMGTRCGAIDPGVLLYLMQQKGMSLAEVEELLYKRSGLLGLSGLSNDMRTLMASDSPRAQLAVSYFCSRIVRELGALAAALGGLDGLVFTGGIGAHAAAIRQRVCHNVAWLGVQLDDAANERGGPQISTAGSQVSAWAMPTDEEWMIAHHTLALLS
ncbi:MAG: acetate/propionate family kinase [Chloroflexales bacterium]|nr:acetate/propionate family kinase [Chloroflexales bacterium]